MLHSEVAGDCPPRHWPQAYRSPGSRERQPSSTTRIARRAPQSRMTPVTLGVLIRPRGRRLAERGGAFLPRPWRSGRVLTTPIRCLRCRELCGAAWAPHNGRSPATLTRGVRHRRIIFAPPEVAGVATSFGRHHRSPVDERIARASLPAEMTQLSKALPATIFGIPRCRHEFHLPHLAADQLFENSHAACCNLACYLGSHLASTRSA